MSENQSLPANLEEAIRDPHTECTPATVAQVWVDALQANLTVAAYDKFIRQLDAVIWDTPDEIQRKAELVLRPEPDERTLREIGSAVLTHAFHDDILITRTGNDPLTGAHNRVGRDRWLASNYGIGENPPPVQRRRNARGLHYFDIDLTYFKGINDRVGHGVGDATLVAAVRALRNSVREDALLVRDGGDEFKLYIPDAPETDGPGILHRLRAAELAKVTGGRYLNNRRRIDELCKRQENFDRYQIKPIQVAENGHQSSEKSALFIDGELVVVLDELAVLAIGHSYAKLLPGDTKAYKAMVATAEQDMIRHKKILQSHMGDAPRGR